MKRTTIFVPEPLERDLQLYARRENKPMAWVVREALTEYLATRRAKSALPSFTGIGNSGRSDVARRHEELLWTEPHGAAPAAPDTPAAGRPVSRTRRR
jgi:ribbon-helix-helix CopG family protein